MIIQCIKHESMELDKKIGRRFIELDHKFERKILEVQEHMQEIKVECGKHIRLYKLEDYLLGIKHELKVSSTTGLISLASSCSFTISFFQEIGKLARTSVATTAYFAV